MKSIAKKMAVAVMAVAVIVSSLSANTADVQAATKGSNFIKTKTSTVNPSVKTFKRAGTNSAKVVVTVPKSKVKKLGNSSRITVAYGSAKGNKFENVRTRVNATRKNNTYTFTLKNKKLRSYKNTYITVRFDGKSNWSSLKQLDNNKSKFKLAKEAVYVDVRYYTCNGCGKKWCSKDYSNDTKEGVAEVGKALDNHFDNLTYKEVCEHNENGGCGYSFYGRPEKVTTYKWVAK